MTKINLRFGCAVAIAGVTLFSTDRLAAQMRYEPLQVPCQSTIDARGELFLAEGVVSIANVDVVRVGQLVIRLKMDSDVYFDALRLSREEVNVRAFARLQPPDQRAPEDAIFDHAATLDVDVADGSGFQMGGMFGLGDLGFTLFRDRCAYQHLRRWAGKQVQILFRFNRTPSQNPSA